ncbi:hypothetical protein [Bifidobacterium panos]|uniref:T9SS C-terminal target domain-containing protein n=1 Tax=Bifidobacterium panos TaxID=2675321 RepID=A0ABX1SVP7_9BIFI|nr:hypothetical protein [Bifidobacterium sp. DSM 109963]NMN01911.1 T9SS C-terminal target domain-containing protein [Bifidobacterium sp. DSM 109963]
MKQNGRGVRWVRRCVAVLLALAAALVLAVPSAWAAESKPAQQSNPAVNLHADRKTDVNGVTSYKLGNATVKGANASYMVIEVDSGWFTLTVPPPGQLKLFSALNTSGEFLSGESVAVGAKYKYLSFDSSGRDNATFTAKDVQALLRDLMFYLDGDKEQTVSVTVTKPPKVMRNRKGYDPVLFNGNAYAFINEKAPDFGQAYADAQSLTFLGRHGHLMTIESQDEHNLVHRLFGEKNGWIGGMKKSSAEAAKKDGPEVKSPCKDQDWYWVAGPSRGTKFWNGGNKPGQVDNIYAKWADKQPTNFVEECYVQYGVKSTSGAWAATSYYGLPGQDNGKRHGTFPQVRGFYVEFEQIDPTQISRTTATTKTVTVQHQLRDVASSNQAPKVLSFTPYETMLTALNKRGFDVSSLRVSVGGRSLRRETDAVSFNRKTGKLRIRAANVTDDVRIEMGANWLVTIRDVWSDEPLTILRASSLVPLKRDSLNEKVGARDGYTLVGYVREGAEWNFDDLVTGDMTLNPRWVLDAPVVTVTPKDGQLGGRDDKVTLQADAKLSKVRTVTFTYQWFKDGVKMPGQTRRTLAVSEAGEYAVEVTATDSTTKLSSQAKAAAVVTAPSQHTVTLRGRDPFSTLLEQFTVVNGDKLDKAELDERAKRSGYSVSKYTTTDGGEWLFADGVRADTVLYAHYELDAPAVTVTAVPPKLTSVGDKSTLNAQVRPPVTGATVSYQWFKGGVPIAGATGASHETDQWGDYTVQVTVVDSQTGMSSVGVAPVTVSAPAKHTVTVREKDGSVTHLKVDVFHGGTVGARALGGVSKRGYVLDGWVKADGTRFDPAADKITGDLVISPVWQPAERAAPLSDTGLTVVAPVVAVVLLLVVAGVLAVLRWRRK